MDYGDAIQREVDQAVRKIEQGQFKHAIENLVEAAKLKTELYIKTTDESEGVLAGRDMDIEINGGESPP